MVVVEAVAVAVAVGGVGGVFADELVGICLA